MKTPLTPSPGSHRASLISLTRLGALAVFLFVMAAFFYSGSSASSLRQVSPAALPNSQNPSSIAQAGQVRSLKAWNSTILSPSLTMLQPLLPAPVLSPEGIATYAPDCSTPKSDFNLGDTVCAKATGVPVTVFSWHVSWVDPVGFIRQSDTAVPDDQATYLYNIPNSPTSVVNGQTVSNVGTWRVNLTRFSGAIRQTARFTVHEPLNPSADVFVQKFERSGTGSVPAGGNIAFVLVVGNQGPDTATQV
ncbi:MAG: hypothetical protein M3R69_07885, partial [Acidobacteriota bacterium]|nr:hypothetical protein [Acidobacteriota bacterium]